MPDKPNSDAAKQAAAKLAAKGVHRAQSGDQAGAEKAAEMAKLADEILNAGGADDTK